MDFILALTHFCEVHGPKSVLCTQLLPLECAQCLSPSANLDPCSSSESLATQVHDPDALGLQRPNTHITLPKDFSKASTTIDSLPPSPTIERHPLFVEKDGTHVAPPAFRHGRAQGDTCASCSFTVPQDVAVQLPSGAPGSVRSDGKSKNGSPVLRSRELVCLGDSDHTLHPKTESPDAPQYSKRNSTSSFHSYLSTDSNCHDHLMTYLTTRSPDNPSSFSTLRASVIRTLSCELLPRGMSDGPLCFGDPVAGYTIAYVFRLTDPKARGRRRAYGFVALAGRDASRAFRACPLVWEAFAAMAQNIEQAAQRSQEELKQKEADEEASKTRNYTPVSSFLTQRAVDPDGYPRRAGQVSPRSLAEIVGNENIFPLLHQFFVAVLRCLGERFGGVPMSENSALDHIVSPKPLGRVSKSSTLDEQRSLAAAAAAAAAAATESEDKMTITTSSTAHIEAAMTKIKVTASPVTTPSQCGPLHLDTPGGHQVMV